MSKVSCNKFIAIVPLDSNGRFALTKLFGGQEHTYSSWDTIMKKNRFYDATPSMVKMAIDNESSKKRQEFGAKTVPVEPSVKKKSL